MYFEGRLGDRLKIWCEDFSEYQEALEILVSEGFNQGFQLVDTPVGLFVGVRHNPHSIVAIYDLPIFQSCDTYRQVGIHQLRAASSSSYQNPEIDIGSLTALVDSLMK